MTKKRKIMIVDDEDGFASMVKLNLEEKGPYEVLVESNALLAYNAAIRHRPDLIFLDIIMPEMEGPDVFFQITNDKEIKDIPVVFLTATVTREEVQNQQGVIGGRRFLAKPSSVDELIACIEHNIPYE